MNLIVSSGIASSTFHYYCSSKVTGGTDAAFFVIEGSLHALIFPASHSRSDTGCALESELQSYHTDGGADREVAAGSISLVTMKGTLTDCNTEM